MEDKLAQLQLLVEKHFEHEGADHDFQHILRVLNTALYIQKLEGGNRDLVIAGALLHDISDHKLNGGKLNNNGVVAQEILAQLKFEDDFIQNVIELVDKVSFKGAAVEDEQGSLELAIVRDADRMDAIGAIGIARAFHFGGARNRALYDPLILPKQHETFEQYAKDKSHTINHFYEKLLLLKDRMQTKTGRELAAKRHRVMEDYLTHFLEEWNINELLN